MLHQFLIRCIEFSLRDFVPNRFAGTHGRGGNSIFAFVFLLNHGSALSILPPIREAQRALGKAISWAMASRIEMRNSIMHSEPAIFSPNVLDGEFRSRYHLLYSNLAATSQMELSPWAIIATANVCDSSRFDSTGRSRWKDSPSTISMINSVRSPLL